MPERPPADELRHDLSPLAQVPRAAGEEVDDERLIARLHAAIAKETGTFGLPWWQAPWLRTAALSLSALVLAIAIWQAPGLITGPTPGTTTSPFGDPDEIWLSDRLADWNDSADMTTRMQRQLDLLARQQRGAEQTTLFGDPASAHVESSSPPADFKI